MKLLYAVLLAAAFTAPACDKKKDAAKTDPAAKTADPAKADPATPDPAAKTADPAKTEPAKTEPASTVAVAVPAGKSGSQYTVDEAGAISLAYADKMLKAIDGSGGDCTKMGANLKVLDVEMKSMSELERDFNKDAAKKAEFAKKYEPQISAKLQDSLPKLQTCMANADVKAFIDGMASD